MSELVSALLKEAIEDGRAASHVSCIETKNATERANLTVVEIRRKLGALRKQCALHEGALSSVDIRVSQDSA